MSKARINYSDYLGFLQRDAKSVLPESSYVLVRYGDGTWLLRLCSVKKGILEHLGTINLLEVLDIAGKSHLDNLRKDEFYDALEKIFGVDFSNRLYADADVETVMKRIGTYSKNVAMGKKIKKDFFTPQKNENSEAF